jgi:hypothetical protein
MAGKSPEFDNQSYREKIPVVPIIDDGLVVMVGVDGGGNPDLNDFAGYDPSEEDILQAWKDTHNGLPPDSESAEKLEAFIELRERTQEYHAQLSGEGSSSVTLAHRRFFPLVTDLDEGYKEYLADFPDAPDVYGMRRKGLRGRILARIVLFTFSAGIDFGFKRNRSRLSDVQEVADLAFINPATGRKDTNLPYSPERYYDNQGGTDE